jgi:uncharacterized protein (TIGR00251 family)
MPLIKVKVHAGAKREKIEEIESGVFKISVQEPPEKGKANARVTKLLAEHFNVPLGRVTLVSGGTFREKIFSIDI